MPTSRPSVLVINSGSSSLKFTLLPADGGPCLMSGLAERLGNPDARLIVKRGGARTETALGGGAHREALAALFAQLDADALLADVAVVGHRVVHGGERFTASALITPDVLRDIEAVSPLAPLHNPAHLLGIRACVEGLPDVPQVAVFDTAFHQTMPKAAYAYAVPQRLYRDHAVRRYGFHGTSHRFVAGETVRLAGFDPHDHGLVIAHLGNGASATAVLDGKSVDTSMGMTPLEGLVMGTRSGDIDFGALAHIARVTGMSLDDIDEMLNQQSGLLGLSELASDCRTLESSADEGHAGAAFALDVFAHRLARYVGALATSLPRLDALVFTGGIGENSVRVRSMTVRRLAVLGCALDAQANLEAVRGRCGRIDAGRGPQIWVVATDEEGLIARDALRLAGIA
jgi:acetate kinase